MACFTRTRRRSSTNQGEDWPFGRSAATCDSHSGRQEILEFLKEKQISFFSDSTNRRVSFQRNRIRNELIPYIRKNSLSIRKPVHKLTIKTRKKREVVDITDTLESWLVKKYPEKPGICNLLVLHTTAALTTADLDPGTDLDMLDAFRRRAGSRRRGTSSSWCGTTRRGSSTSRSSWTSSAPWLPRPHKRRAARSSSRRWRNSKNRSRCARPRRIR